VWYGIDFNPVPKVPKHVLLHKLLVVCESLGLQELHIVSLCRLFEVLTKTGDTAGLPVLRTVEDDLRPLNFGLATARRRTLDR